MIRCSINKNCIFLSKNFKTIFTCDVDVKSQRSLCNLISSECVVTSSHTSHWSELLSSLSSSEWRRWDTIPSTSITERLKRFIWFKRVKGIHFGGYNLKKKNTAFVKIKIIFR